MHTASYGDLFFFRSSQLSKLRWIWKSQELKFTKPKHCHKGLKLYNLPFLYHFLRTYDIGFKNFQCLYMFFITYSLITDRAFLRWTSKPPRPPNFLWSHGKSRSNPEIHQRLCRVFRRYLKTWFLHIFTIKILTWNNSYPRTRNLTLLVSACKICHTAATAWNGAQQAIHTSSLWWVSIHPLKDPQPFLVGGFNPFEKY